jgi:hypothetical protein
LADSLCFANLIGKRTEFEAALMRLLQMALGAAVPQKEMTLSGGEKFPEQSGRDRKITISPDNFNAPSFAWYEERGMVGGLIWHGEGNWSIHT